MRLLVIEDDPMIGSGILTGLRQEGYTADWVRDGDAAELATTTNDYDAILLDLGLPGKSGLELLAQWRRQQNTLPILTITARDSVEVHIHALRREIGSATKEEAKVIFDHHQEQIALGLHKQVGA